MIPADPIPSSARTTVGAGDPSTVISNGLQAGKDFFVFDQKSYTWGARIDLDSYANHPNKTLILRGAGGLITTVNSSGNGFTTSKVGIYHALFDHNRAHGFEMEYIDEFELVKAIAQRNMWAGIYSRYNRTSGIIRGAHVEQNGAYDNQYPSDWGINVSYGTSVHVSEAYCTACRIWVDHSSCSVRNCAVFTEVPAVYNSFSVGTGTQPPDTSMICGYAAKSNNYDLAKLPGTPCPHT